MDNPAEEQLKSALLAADFTEAQRLIPVYSQDLVSFFAGASTQQEQQQAIESFQSLLSLARVMRAHLSAQILQLQRQSRYQYQAPPSDKHAWQFEG